MAPTYPLEKFTKRVVFPTDPTSRRDIQDEIDATREAVYAQMLAVKEGKKVEEEDKRREEIDMLSQIKESLQMANQKKRNLLFQERRYLDEENDANIRHRSQ